MTIWSELLESMARTLFVMAYADHCDECLGCERCPDRAGPGEDWFDVAPPGPFRYRRAALRLLHRVEGALNAGRSLPGAVTRAFDAAGVHRRSPTVADLGFCLAMEALGTGVAWTDDHPPHGLTVPRIENEPF